MSDMFEVPGNRLTEMTAELAAATARAETLAGENERLHGHLRRLTQAILSYQVVNADVLDWPDWTIEIDAALAQPGRDG
jgi:hypothetical protein